MRNSQRDGEQKNKGDDACGGIGSHSFHAVPLNGDKFMGTQPNTHS